MNVIDQTSSVDCAAIVLNSVIGKKCFIGRNSRFCYSELGDYSYVSENSHVFSSSIGRFTSISWNVSIGPAKHDYTRGSQHSMIFAPRFGMISERDDAAYDQYSGGVSIGSDVWIGCGAYIGRGVEVGDGAVVGANAFVSKNVPPYAIVVGVNQILKYRFADEVIEELLRVKWWNWPIAAIEKSIGALSSRLVDVEDVRRLKVLLGEGVQNEG